MSTSLSLPPVLCPSLVLIAHPGGICVKEQHAFVEGAFITLFMVSQHIIMLLTYKSECWLGTAAGVSSARTNPSWPSHSRVCLLPQAFAGSCPSHRLGFLPRKETVIGKLQADGGHLEGMLDSQREVTWCPQVIVALMEPPQNGSIAQCRRSDSSPEFRLEVVS